MCRSPTSGPQLSASVNELLDFDSRATKPDTSVSGIVSATHNMATQQAVKMESLNTNGTAVKDETSLTVSSQPEGLKSFSYCVLSYRDHQNLLQVSFNCDQDFLHLHRVWRLVFITAGVMRPLTGH